MDGRTSTEENRRLLAALHDSGELGELLFSEAAAALLDSPDALLADYPSDYDVDTCFDIAAESDEEYGLQRENP